MGNDDKNGEQNQPPPTNQLTEIPVHSQLPTSQDPSVQDAAYWQSVAEKAQSRYDGLSGHAKKEKNRADSLDKNLVVVTSEYEKYKLDTSASLANLTTQLTESRTLAEKLQSENIGLKRTDEVGQLVRTDFPELAPLFDKGLIRGLADLEGDDLKKYLTELASTLGQQATDTSRSNVSGSTPPPAGGATDVGTMTLAEVQDIYQKAMTTFRSGTPEHTAALALYVDQVAQLDKKK